MKNLLHSTDIDREPVKVCESELPLLGTSPRFVECLKLIKRVAATNLPVLITGESGTGKELIAREIHRRSERAVEGFVTVNCSAMPNELIESELFGHERGSFTGADRARVGLWEEASGGTLFLDEITETSPQFQVKLLRALQEGEIRRVGSNRNISVDVRVIAASNRDVEAAAQKGLFREDLLYRLNAITINLPPLRERLEDIPLLAEHFVRRGSGLGRPVFARETLQLFQRYQWPGNVRELENAVLRAVTLSDEVIHPEHLPARILKKGVDDSDLENKAAPTSPWPIPWLSLAELAQAYATHVLEHTHGNKQAAARILQIDRKTLARIVNRQAKSDVSQVV